MPESVSAPPAANSEDGPTDGSPPSGAANRLRVVLLMAGSCLPILGAVLIAPVLPKMQDAFGDTGAAADRGRGTGLWMAAFFTGEFACPLLLLAGEAAVGTLAASVGLLAAATGVVATVLLLLSRRAVLASASLE
ncbi:hypothetical protein Acsp04_22550 [Actinomadura sp. NBRC 104425]|uniref:hypothetical protein n=1 Tax=Actinomadura sp. NBRC 104425 TaxID=3032204 RepID=UPI0024A46623|nr:hypothetical protein [Actinomadura sp. NBRC 104425]GLZ12020.1 hypothetical protein Acsp04_22550 [Actinomadura sp. NBRC 104425]